MTDESNAWSGGLWATADRRSPSAVRPKVVQSRVSTPAVTRRARSRRSASAPTSVAAARAVGQHLPVSVCQIEQSVGSASGARTQISGDLRARVKPELVHRLLDVSFDGRDADVSEVDSPSGSGPGALAKISATPCTPWQTNAAAGSVTFSTRAFSSATSRPSGASIASPPGSHPHSTETSGRNVVCNVA